MAIRRVSAAVCHVARKIARMAVTDHLASTGCLLESLEGRRLFAGGNWYKITGISDAIEGLNQSEITGALSLAQMGWVQAESIEAAIKANVTGTITAYYAGVHEQPFPSEAYRVNGSTITLDDTYPDGDYDYNDYSWNVDTNVDIKPFVDPGVDCNGVPLGEVPPGYVSPQNTSAAPVNYADGSLVHQSEDLATSAFGRDFGHTRRWTNRGGAAYRNINGSGFVVSEQPKLIVREVQAYDDILEPAVIQVVFSATTSAWFDRVDVGTYVSRFGRGELLTATTVQDDSDTTRLAWHYTDAAGNSALFYGFVGSAAALPEFQRGAMHSMVDEAGNTLATEYDSNGRLSEYSQTGTVNGVSVTESMLYTYVGSGVNAGLLDTVTLRRKTGAGAWDSSHTVRSVAYSYYVDSDANGSDGDLKLAEVKDASGSVIASKYYRYYESGESLGFQHALKYVVEDAAYERLKTAASGDVSAASNSLVGDYAQFYFEYDSDHRVTSEKAQALGCSSCTGGYGTFTFTYTDSANSADFNNWARKTIETLPDGNQNIVYSNAFGQPILRVFKEGASEWKDFYRYDDKGKLLLHANPSAVTGYSESYADLVNYNSGTGGATYLSSSNGLIEMREYGTANSAGTTTPGDVIGYLKSTSVKQGTGGSAILTASQAYIARNDGVSTTYFIGSETRYRNTGGTGAQTTNYAYTWQGSTKRMATRTVTRPAATGAQNGSDETVSTTEYFDEFGRAVWVVDEDGFLVYNKYDEKTGALKQQIRDVNTNTLAPSTVAVSSLSSVGTTATATTSGANEFAVGHWVKIAGASPSAYNGTFRITAVLSSTQFQYVMASSPGSTASGTLTAQPATPTTGGLHLITDIAVDSLGRRTKVTDPNGNVTYITYNDVTHETRTYAGWNATTGTATGPTQVTRQDWARGYAERLLMSASPTTSGSAGSYAPTGTETVSDVESLRRDIQNGAGQVVEQTVYTSLIGTSYSQSTVKFGIEGTNYLRGEIGYDSRGRRARVKTADGTWTHTVYDGLGRESSTWKGTNNTGWTQTNPAGSGSPNNMLKVSESIYDGGGVGDSNLTERCDVIADGSTPGTDFYVTKYLYDFRDRITGVRGADNIATGYTLDNLGQETVAERYADSDADFVIDTGELRGKVASSYDERGQVFESTVYEVDPSTGVSPGTIRDGLTTEYWYDARGNLAKSREANGEQNKSVFDGANRLTKTYITIDADETAYGELNSVTDDRVMEQNNTVYDKGGRVVHTVSMKRKSDSPSTGAFHPDNSWSQSLVYFYDAADRKTADVNYGSEFRADYDVNGNTISPAPTRIVYTRSTGAMIDTNSNGIPEIAEGSVPSAPSSANETNYGLIVTGYAYDSAGRLYRVTDNKSRITQTDFDLAGRKTAVIENYVDGTASASDVSQDRVTQYAYDAQGRLSTITAKNANGSTVTDQITKFAFGSAIDRSWVTATIYPDSDDTISYDGSGNLTLGNGTDSTRDRDDCTFDRLGRKATCTDQRGVVHTFTYDTAGRLSSDSIGTGSLPSNVEGTLRTIEYGYDDLSRNNLVTSKNSAGTVVNQVKLTFDGWGNVSKSEQAHNGSVGGGTPSVQYAYADGASSGVAKYVRLDTVTYPNGRVIQYQYGTSGTDEDVLNNVNTVRDNTASKDLATYDWVGAHDFARIIQHPSITGGLTLTYSGTTMLGKDRFDRVVRQQWRPEGSGEADRIDYKYDRAGNRVAMDRNVSIGSITTDDNFSESYEYDGLDRLVDYRRGKQDGTGFVPKSPTDATNLLYRQTWATLDGSGNVSGVKLDSLGNWTQSTTDTNGGTAGGSTTQSRSFNSVNEIDLDNTDGDADDAITGVSWIDPVYDKSGNMSTLPKGGNESTAVYFIYDGWNRVAGISSTASHDGDFADTGEVQYEYDGAGRRISKDFAGGTTNDEDTYWSEGYQALETRKAGSSNPYEQHVWDMTYIDAPIVRYRDSDANGSLDETLYATFDANFNVMGLVQENGTFVERFWYTPYGQRFVLDGNFANDADGITDYDWQVGHQGLKFDTESGTYYNRARQLHETLGGYAERDPIPVAQQHGMNMYQAFRSNPIILIDPMGKQFRYGPNWMNRQFHPDRIPHPYEVSMMVGKAAVEGASDGTMAWVNGLIPFGDPIPSSWFYEPCDEMLWYSEVGGHISRDAWLAGLIPNLGTWARNPLYYEVGSKTLPAAQWAQYSGYSVLERGALIIRHVGIIRALAPTTSVGAYSSTVIHWTGLTPGGWLFVLGGVEAVDSATVTSRCGC